MFIITIVVSKNLDNFVAKLLWEVRIIAACVIATTNNSK